MSSITQRLENVKKLQAKRLLNEDYWDEINDLLLKELEDILTIEPQNTSAGRASQRHRAAMQGLQVLYVGVSSSRRQREVGDSLGQSWCIKHQRYGKARTGGVLIVGARL